MAKLEDLKPGLHIKGLVPQHSVAIVDVQWHGTSAVELFYKRADGQPGAQLLFRDDEERIEFIEAKRTWTFDADGGLFKLVAEAYRIHLAHLFDKRLAVHTSLIEPLPHQITGVYGEMLPRQLLRFLLADLRHMGRGDHPVAPGQWPSRLETLKRCYIETYAVHHRRMVLGPAGDDRREEIRQGEPLRQVRELDRLHLLPTGDLQAWKRKLVDLKTCRGFHEGLLDDEPVCPYCRLNPSAERTTADACATLDALEEQLDQMLANWQGAVVSVLQSEVAQRSLAAMTPDEKRAIQRFLENPQMMTLPQGFIEAANKALRGIESLPLAVEELLAALREGGLPCTVDEFQARFNRFLQGAMRGHDESNTRITLADERAE